MDLSDFFLTKAQATDFSVRLAAVIDQMYTTSFSLEKALSEQFGMQKKDAFMKLLRENNISSSSTTAVQEFLKKIQDSLTNLPLVEINIAFEPTNETLKVISQWFGTTLHRQVILQVAIDTSLIAGAKVTCNGKFKDYSIAKQFGEIVSHALTPQAQTGSNPMQRQSTESMEIGR